MSIISDLINKKIDTDSAVKKALEDNVILSELLEGIQSSQDPVRYSSYKVISLISENYPEALYPEWSLFEKMLEHSNSYFKLIGVRIIANLTGVDTEKRFEKIFYKYFGELGSKKTMLAAHVAGNAGKIALVKTGLQSSITDKLVNIESMYHGKQIDLVKGYAIESFGQYFDKTSIKDRDRILKLVKKEADSASPRTRKLASEFLKKWEPPIQNEAK